MTHWARCHLAVLFPDAILRDGRFFSKFRAYELFSTLLYINGHCYGYSLSSIKSSGSYRP